LERGRTHLKKTVRRDEQSQKHKRTKPYRVTRGGIGPTEHAQTQRDQDSDERALVNAVQDGGKEAITDA